MGRLAWLEVPPLDEKIRENAGKRRCAEKMAAARKKHVVSGKVCLNCVVKRKGELEEFDERKVYSSVYEAAMSSHYSEKKAEELADNVTKLVEKKFKKAHEIDSRQIFEHVVESLEKFDKEVAFMYETHRDLS